MINRALLSLKNWVNTYNSSSKVEHLIEKGWNTLYPINTYINSDSDDKPYEGKYKGETSTGFPHAINEIYKQNKSSFRPTPFGNTLTLDFAKAALDAYQLGRGSATDFLTICST